MAGKDRRIIGFYSNDRSNQLSKTTGNFIEKATPELLRGSTLHSEIFPISPETGTSKMFYKDL
jgi:hypothetical protein